jgi:hypothetical protein
MMRYTTVLDPYGAAKQASLTVTEILPASASWGTPADLTELSTVVHNNSANWNSDYSTVRSLSAIWSGSRILQTVFATSTASGSTSVTLPNDNTIPQNTEGAEYMTLTISPSSSASNLLLEFTGFVGSNAASTGTVAFFRNSEVNALAATSVSFPAATHTENVTLRMLTTSTTTTALTFKIRYGGNSGTLYMMRNSGGDAYLTAKQALFSITEFL